MLKTCLKHDFYQPWPKIWFLNNVSLILRPWVFISNYESVIFLTFLKIHGKDDNIVIQCKIKLIKIYNGLFASCILFFTFLCTVYQEFGLVTYSISLPEFVNLSRTIENEVTSEDRKSKKNKIGESHEDCRLASRVIRGTEAPSKIFHIIQLQRL